MKSLLSLVAVTLLLLSCSKKENTAETPAETAAPPAVPAGAKQVELTAEQIEKVAWQIFKKLHFENLPDDSVSMAYVEEFAITGDRVQYKLLRHNGENIGWIEADSPPEPRYVDLEGEGPYADESDGGEDFPQYGENSSPKMYYFKDQLDTLIYDGNYLAYVEEEVLEKGVTTVRIVFTGLLLHENAYEAQSGDEDTPLVKTPIHYQVSELLVDLQSPIVVDGDQIYLRAKMADLTDQDLAGMTKDQLSYARNEIFARHGHTFKTPKMLNYFGDQYWYHYTIDDAAGLLNKFEKRNVEFIKKKEG